MIEVIGIRGIPLIEKGDDLAHIIYNSLKKENLLIHNDDILVVTQKIISKSEGRLLQLDTISPSRFAQNIGKYMDKDPRLIEVILRESKSIIKMKGNHLITEYKTGYICANAGVDQSNVDDKASITLLPENPDRSADRIRLRLKEITGIDIAVIITDTSGRPFRMGQINLAIGSSGIEPIRDYKDKKDMFGLRLTVTAIAIVDEIASAAELVMNKTDKIPAVLIRGYRFKRSNTGIKNIHRHPKQDLFT